MTYSPTTWINNSTPALNAANLNKMETGIDEAHDAANITNTPFNNIEAVNVQDAIDELETEKENTVTAHHARHETGGGDVIADAIAAGNSGLMTGVDKTKIDGIEALADVTDTANVDSAGAVMESDYNAQTIMMAVFDDTPLPVGISVANVVGRTAIGNVESLTMAQLRADTMLDVEESADVTDAANVASTIHGVVAKVIPVDADEVGLIDSAAANVLKKLTWANIKATLKTYLDTLYAGLGANTNITSMTGLTTPLDETYGGTGLTTYAQGDTVYASGSNTLAKLTKGTATQVLTMNAGATAPEWAAAGGGGAGDELNLGSGSEVTINTSGQITVTKAYHTVDTYGDAATDDLTRILGGTVGDIVVLGPIDDTRTVVVKHGSYIRLNGGVDFSLDHRDDTISLITRNGTMWQEISRANNT